MKRLALATMVALTTTTHAITIEDVMNQPKLALTALGVVDYYDNNCHGLTSRGNSLLNKVVRKHGFDKANVVELTNSTEYKHGYEVSAGFGSCNKLRRALTDAGAGALFR